MVLGFHVHVHCWELGVLCMHQGVGPDFCLCCVVLLQVSRLQKNVDDLQHALLKSLHDRQPTVIYAGNSKSGCVAWNPAGCDASCMACVLLAAADV